MSLESQVQSSNVIDCTAVDTVQTTVDFLSSFSSVFLGAGMIILGVGLCSWSLFNAARRLFQWWYLRRLSKAEFVHFTEYSDYP